MKYESKKLSQRSKDGIDLAAIIFEINRIFYSNYISFLPMLNSINEFQNTLLKETINTLNSRGIPEKILDLYSRNVGFFNRKYKLTKEILNNLKTVEEKGDLILERMIKTYNFSTNESKATSIKDIVFGENDINITECPIILKNIPKDNKNSSDASSYYLVDGQINSSDFYKDISTTKDFSIPSIALKPSTDGKLIKYTGKQDKYYFDQKYLQNVKTGSDFHFETFICFDFDENNFLSKISNNHKNFLLKSGIDFEFSLYRSLNLALFLSEKNNIVKDIVVNPTYFNKYFSKGIKDSTWKDQYQAFLSYASKFIKNVRYGLRLVYRYKSTSLSSGVNVDNDIKTRNKTFFVKDSNNLDNFVTSDVSTNKIDRDFTSLEYNTIKSKSYIIWDGNESSATLTNSIPVISVYENVGDFDPAKDYVFTKEIMDSLKNQMMKTQEFIFVFEKMIPIKQLLVLEEVSLAAKEQEQINKLLASDTEETQVAKSIQQTMLKTSDIMLKDSKEY